MMTITFEIDELRLAATKDVATGEEAFVVALAYDVDVGCLVVAALDLDGGEYDSQKTTQKLRIGKIKIKDVMLYPSLQALIDALPGGDRAATLGGGEALKFIIKHLCDTGVDFEQWPETWNIIDWSKSTFSSSDSSADLTTYSKFRQYLKHACR